MRSIRLVLILAFFSISVSLASSETIFVEAESFNSTSKGWSVVKGRNTKKASALTALHGASGDPKATANKMITIKESGSYRIWVRYIYSSSRRGSFRLAMLKDSKELAGKDFDLDVRPKARNWSYVWDSFDVDLSAGILDMQLSKYQNKNCSGYVRYVDCILITTDKDLTPSHVPYGNQTYLRVTMGDIYEQPVYVHIFADHYRWPWYGHYSLSRSGTSYGYKTPDKDQKLLASEQTPWCNITPMLYQDSGAILNITIRHTYHKKASRMKARFEFASDTNEASIVRTMDVESEPNGLVVVVPPDLIVNDNSDQQKRNREMDVESTSTGIVVAALPTQSNRNQLKRDLEFAEETGRIADAFPWPTIGKIPEKFPFFVKASVGGYCTPVDKAIDDREWKTLDYFGFSNKTKTHIGGGIWYMKEKSYCRPDIERMKIRAVARAETFAKTGKKAKDIAYCILMDEPTGQSADFMVKDEAYHEAFRAWVKKLGKSPRELLVADWNAVKPVSASERDKYPGLHYFTQRFRTRALGAFLATQREIIEDTYDHTFPIVVNFSDGATYTANFYSQGVDYFELLSDDGQNAIWGEDWANNSSSYQCGAYNVDLMRAAARFGKQTIGHYIIAHAGRKSWDIKLKTVGEVARGAKILMSYFYGVNWGAHTHGWYGTPSVWRANAEIIREIGGAEDLLLPAMPKPAKTAILYSSSSDIWMMGRNNAYGFERMNTWMALAHAQIPVDFLSERYIEEGMLEKYQVCYLSGQNLTRTAAERVKIWVENGGTLFLTAGAASRDEFNQPLDILTSIIPAKREEKIKLQPFLSSGKFLYALHPKGEVAVGKTKIDVLSAKQMLVPRTGADVLATFKDGTPAFVYGRAGKGGVYCAGFLPALDYVRKALVARQKTVKAKEKADKDGIALSPVQKRSFAILNRSSNPWEYPDDVRAFILTPVRATGINPQLTCSAPLVDAVVMTCKEGVVIPLANNRLEPIEKVDFIFRPDRLVDRIETIYHGKIKFIRKGNAILFSIPLDCTDFIKIYYQKTK